MKTHNINDINQQTVDKISDIITQDFKDIPNKQNIQFLAQRMAKENDSLQNPILLAHNFIRCAESLIGLVQKRNFGCKNLNIYQSDQISFTDAPVTVIELVNDDMPFIVDSITQLLAEREIEIVNFFHPVVCVERDQDGNFINFSPDGISTSENSQITKILPESLVQIHVAQIISEPIIDAIKQEIKQIIHDIQHATCDWQVMLRKLDGIITEIGSEPAPIDHDTRQESVSFLRWLGADHFTFLGARSYKFEGDDVVTIPDSGLGLFRNPDYVALRHDGDMVDSFPELKKLAYLEMPITILKTNVKSTVHRRSHMDQIWIVYYQDGKAIGLHCFIGLFTSTAYIGHANKVPLLERKIDTIMKKSGFRMQSHDGKLLSHILDTYPRDELFQSDIDTLYQITKGIISLDQRPAIRVFSRHDLFNRFVSCLVYLPKERLNTDNRLKIGELLAKSYGGRVSTYSIWFSETGYVRIKYIIAVTPSSLLEPDIDKLEAKVKRITTDWRDSFIENYVDYIHNQNNYDEIPLSFAKEASNSFSIAYQDHFSPKQAIKDIEILQKIDTETSIICDIKTSKHDENITIFRLFHYDGPVALSDCLPIFENLGFKVLTEHPFDLKYGHHNIQLHQFGMQYQGKLDSPQNNYHNLSEAFIAISKGIVEDDRFNNLILEASLSYRQVVVLRAFARYLKQAGIPYSHQKIAECLLHNAHISTLLWEMFDIRHNPALANIDRSQKTIEIEDKINKALADVPELDQDTIIRRYVNLIKATLRTNFYQDQEHVSFKLDCALIDNLPLPVPYREIWVYSPRVEGVHLRFGKVARGGLRWSDRREDFRTEVLGLVKAQQVKNAVIVPVGAKGGFYAKKLPLISDSREAWLAEGIEAYKIFISGLLDITDNIAGDDIIVPKRVVRHDEDDPYLVVAADKGTATFSDIANELSLKRNFWLGDAFASGGGNGYDHKKMGITARGAWEAVKRHFRELGKDIQTEEFTVCGVGDMSGDVFGNGMLLSEKIRLVAAFDHRDIFIDPNPDSAISFAERQRLFDLPRSSWQDYNKQLLSQGGRVYSRSEKSIELTPEIKKLTGLTADKVRPNELIKAILKLDTELLWFGGIGTYIRSPQETNMQVGDKANDALRITADQVRAKVIGEGANLGLTQLSRITLAMNGVMVNTDAVDNSAGVDCSDHEVNIKIALGTEQVAGRMNEAERNQLLEQMTDEVAELVLQTNYNQTLGLSLTTAAAPRRTELHARYIRFLEENAGLNRSVEYLPDDRTLLAGRNGYKGLTRPELSVVMAYSKLYLYDVILNSSIPDEPLFEEIVREYMPSPLRSMNEALDNHKLRREIITTVITNRAINEGGISFIFRLSERLNITTEHAMRSYIAARRMMDFGSLLDKINGLDNKIPHSIQQKLYVLMRASLFDQTRCIALRNHEGFDIAKTVETYRDHFIDLMANIHNNFNEPLKKKLEEFMTQHQHDNLLEGVCRKVCALYFMKNGFDIIDIALESNRSVHQTFCQYFQIIEMLGMDELRRKATEIALPDIYDQMALSQIISEMDLASKDFVMKIISSEEDITDWFSNNSVKIEKFQETFADAVAVPQLSLSRLSIITGALRQLSID